MRAGNASDKTNEFTTSTQEANALCSIMEGLQEHIQFSQNSIILQEPPTSKSEWQFLGRNPNFP